MSRLTCGTDNPEQSKKKPQSGADQGFSQNVPKTPISGEDVLPLQANGVKLDGESEADNLQSLTHAEPLAATTPAAMREAALSYARRGWCVFPAPPGKKSSYKSAKYSNGRNWGNTTDPDEIKRDWKRWPDACIGIATGRESGAWVFEADTKEGHAVDGFASLAALEAKHGELPETLIVFSPSGSKHFYFQYPADCEINNSTSNIGKGLDVRGEGGMVIAPPSNRPGKGTYRWGNDAAIAPAPQWLIDAANADHRKAEPDAADDASTTLGPDVAIDLEEDAGAGLELQRDLTLKEVQAALVVIDPDCDRTTWFNIGCALFSHFGADDGFAIWDDWSKTAKKKYPGQRYMREQWKTIRDKDGYAKNIATLFWHANAADPNWQQSVVLDEEHIEEPTTGGNSEPIKSPSATRSGNIITFTKKSDRNGSAVLVCAKDIIMRPKQWIWEGHLLRGAQEILTGAPGLGKSQLQISIIACATSGKVWPDGTANGHRSNVIMLTAEDVLDQEVVPRLIAAGADLNRVHILKSIKADGKDRQFLLGEDLVALEQAVASIGDVVLIAIDPITAYMGGKIDSHKTTEVRSQLGPLKDFAERIDVAVSTITHPPKATSQKAIDHFIGSQAFIANARIGHVCIEETEEEESDEEGGKPKRVKTGRVLFAIAKTNVGKMMPTLAYRIDQIVVEDRSKEGGINISAPYVVWDKEPVDISADEAVSSGRQGQGGGNRGAQMEVQRFLRNLLNKEPVAVKQIEEEADRLGFTQNQLKTAKAALRAKSIKLSGTGGWAWELPM